MARKRAKGRTKGRPSGAARRGRGKTRGAAARRPAVKTTKGAKTAKKKTVKKAAKPRPQARKTVKKKAAKGKPAPAARKVIAPKTRRPKLSPPEPIAPGHPPTPPSLERQRRQLREVEDNIPTPPSSLDLDRTPSAARSGRAALNEARHQHNETSPELTGGDVDANWEDGYAVGDESPGGDNPTPDQDRVDDIGKALGVQYEDNEELKSADKIANRDKHRWELDPASAEDYPDHEE
jgi:hypothetical protein